MPFADPEKRRQYDAEHKRRMRVAEPCPTRLTLPVEFRAKTAADVLALLNEQIETVRQDHSLGSVERAKSVGSLAGPPRRIASHRRGGRGGAGGSVGVDLEITTEAKGWQHDERLPLSIAEKAAVVRRLTLFSLSNESGWFQNPSR